MQAKYLGGWEEHSDLGSSMYEVPNGGVTFWFKVGTCVFEVPYDQLDQLSSLIESAKSKASEYYTKTGDFTEEVNS
jgi:hypothetical protein